MAIIFASTWICVHPNVAGYNTTKWQKLWKRVKLFALAVFAPELLAVFAFFQWKGCRELHKAFRDKAIELNICTLTNGMSEVQTLTTIRFSPRSRRQGPPTANPSTQNLPIAA